MWLRASVRAARHPSRYKALQSSYDFVTRDLSAIGSITEKDLVTFVCREEIALSTCASLA